jgi:hypothetical protein
VPREVGHDEKQIAELLLDLGLRLAGGGLGQLSGLFRDLVDDVPEASGQSKPTRAARFCSFTARVRAGSATATSSSTPWAARPLRSAALIASQSRVCWAADLSREASPKTCGCRATILSRDRVVRRHRNRTARPPAAI